MLFRLGQVALTLWLLISWLPTSASADDNTARRDAISAYDDGRYEAALESLDRAPPSSDLAYLRIRILADLERYAEALDTSQKIPRDWPPAVVRDLAQLRLSWAASAGRCDVVEAQAKDGGRPSERLLGRCAFATGDYARVKQLLSTAKDAEGRALFIRALIEQDEPEFADPLARTFYIEHPSHRQAARFRTFLERNGTPLTLNPEEHLTRAEALLSARQPETAFDELSSIQKLKDKKLESRIWHLRGEALFRTRKRYPEAHKAFLHAAKLHSETEDYDAFHAARATSRAGDDRAAIKQYKEFAARYPKSRLTPDALFLAAWLSAREKLPNASKDLKAFVASKYAAQSPGLRRDAIWELGFHAFEARAGKDAKKWLEAYEATVDRPFDHARAAYWRGRTALLLHDESEARAQFTRVLEEDRLGYYAQLAARRLMALGIEQPTAFAPDSKPLPRPKLATLPPEVRFYRDLGLYADAADAAIRFLGQEPDRARRIAALLEAGEPNRVSAAAEPLIDRILEAFPTPEHEWAWNALLPRPYLHIVSEQTERNHLDPALFYGHMQVESHYKPRVISSADAMGLMQMLPQTAAKVAEGLQLKFERSDLMRPHINITLGASYLAGLVARYQGQFPLAIAAYNAGTTKVDEWLGRHNAEFELDRWVESIPVEQTRNYVRRVIGGWSRYHALSDPIHPWDLPLPEKVRLPTR